jgi:hypothetical protein
MRRLTREEFIDKAKLVHGDLYGYDLVDYVNSKKPVEIVCGKHGAFLQRPNDHTQNKGCPSCAGNVMSDAVKFAEKAHIVHGYRYDYSLVEYSNNKTPVLIRCSLHGDFYQSPDKHLFGRGCPTCKGGVRSNSDDFISKAKMIHGDRYGYSLVEYTNTKTHVSIDCPIHGIFRQSPDGHLSGQGCPDCRGGVRLDVDTFIINAKKSHGNRYDYSLVDYISAKTKIKILCVDHGEFLQTPDSHIHGNGCPDCAITGYSSTKPGTLYYVRFDLPGLTLWKIGITNRDTEDRFVGFKVKPVIIWQRSWADGNIAAREECRILRGGLYDQYRYKGEPLIKSGYTECFTIDIMQLGNTTRIHHDAA